MLVNTLNCGSLINICGALRMLTHSQGFSSGLKLIVKQILFIQLDLDCCKNG